MAGPDVLLISNGHGEDVVGAALARALAEKAPGARIRAMPTVGRGGPYRDGPAERIGPLRELPGGGTTLQDPSALVRDLRSGVVGATAAQARDLRAVRADVVIAVGDVLAQTFATLPRVRARYAVQTLVSARMRRGPAAGIGVFRHRFTVAERLLLRIAYRHVYPRDADSEEWLRAHGVPHATFLGNPMMDGLDAAPLSLEGPGPRIVALPGSRRSARACLERIAEAVGLLPRAEVVVPWALDERPSFAGWEACASPVAGEAWRRGDVRLHLVRDRFAAALRWGDVAVGATGTAQEQAAGSGLPVVAFPCGAASAPGFLEHQRLLLGEALEVVPARPGAIADAVARLVVDPAERARRGAVGRERMGPAGGAARIAAHVLRDATRADVPRPLPRVP